MNNIKKYRTKNGMKQTELCKVVGITQGALSGWENGRYEPDINSLNIMAQLFGVSVDELLGLDNVDTRQPHSQSDGWIPVLGNVAAGIPADMIESFDSDNPEDWEQLSPDIARNGRHIALRINGPSMEPKMSVGDIVIVRLQESIEDGEVAIVKVNGEEATCKKIKKTPEGLFLISFNPSYEPMFYTAAQVHDLPVQILGKVVELRAKF